MRISENLAVCGLLALPGCSEPAAPSPQEAAALDSAVELIECALGEGSRFGADCSVERVESSPERLVVRHPDGGFRRFEVAADRSGLTAADGADRAVNTLEGDMLEIRVAQDRYRFPARVTDRGNATE